MRAGDAGHASERHGYLRGIGEPGVFNVSVQRTPTRLSKRIGHLHAAGVPREAAEGASAAMIALFEYDSWCRALIRGDRGVEFGSPDAGSRRPVTL